MSNYLIMSIQFHGELIQFRRGKRDSKQICKEGNGGSSKTEENSRDTGDEMTVGLLIC